MPPPLSLFNFKYSLKYKWMALHGRDQVIDMHCDLLSDVQALR